MDSIRELPPILGARSATSECLRQRSRGSQRSRRQRREAVPEQTFAPRLPELVAEDIYLMDNKNRKVTANLLANSLTARLRNNLPEGTVDIETIRKIRRDSLKDFLHLDNLNRQFNSDLQRENSRLDKESFELLKRQKQLHRQSEISRRHQDKLESSIRSRSGLSSASLPLLPAPSEVTTHQTTDSFPEFATVDLEDQSHVKVFKLKGVYQPMNKYSSRIEPFETSKKNNKASQLKETANIQDSLRLADNGTPVDLPSKSRMSKKGLRVSWSRQSKFYPDGDGDSPSRMSRADSRNTMMTMDREYNVQSPSKRQFHSRLSTRSDTFLLKASKAFRGRRKVDTIGLQWKLPPKPPGQTIPEVVQQSPRTVKGPSNGISHNLVPVTTGLNKEGTSIKKMCWQVQKPRTKTRLELYEEWIEKLEMLKSRESVDSSLNNRSIPNRANLSVMTTPA